LPATAWQSNVNLEYGTTYYWKIRAGSPGSYSDWSAVSAFTTVLPENEENPPAFEEPAPVTPVSLVSPSSNVEQPVPPSVSPPSPPEYRRLFPEWLMYISGGFMLVVIVLLVALMVMVAGFKRM
jgi:hypothetical protein